MRHNDTIGEREVHDFWNAHPCGDHIVGGLLSEFHADYDSFFSAYDSWRYKQERHIVKCLDNIDWKNRKVLEIGLGQGAEAEQIIRRGARWSGLDLTQEAVDRVRVRLSLRGLPHDDVRRGTALAIPWSDDSFDVVFSHGVLHHIPDIRSAQSEIHRILKPGGVLVAMLYARRSLNYQVSIKLVRRAALTAAFPLRRARWLRASETLREHLDNAEHVGLRRYLALDRFTHHNTDGPLNPYARVYSPREVAAAFPDFTLVDWYQRYMHAPPLPVHHLPGQRWLGWHLWVHLRVREGSSGNQLPKPVADRGE